MYLWVALPPKFCNPYKLPKGSMQYIHPTTPPSGWKHPFPHWFFFIQHNHSWLEPSPLYIRYWQHWCVLSSPTRCQVWQTRHTSRFKRLNCIDFGIDPPVPTMSTSVASSPFFYVHDGPKCDDLGITPFHDDCHDTSPSPPWCLLCAYGFICVTVSTSATRPQLCRPQLSPAWLLRPQLLHPRAWLPQHQHKGL
jgi:hypothetical protein